MCPDTYSRYGTSVSGIKKYIVGLIIKTSSDSSLLEREKTYLGKLNMILVQVKLELFFEYKSQSEFEN